MEVTAAPRSSSPQAPKPVQASQTQESKPTKPEAPKPPVQNQAPPKPVVNMQGQETGKVLNVTA